MPRNFKQNTGAVAPNDISFDLYKGTRRKQHFTLNEESHTDSKKLN